MRAETARVNARITIRRSEVEALLASREPLPYEVGFKTFYVLRGEKAVSAKAIVFALTDGLHHKGNEAALALMELGFEVYATRHYKTHDTHPWRQFAAQGLLKYEDGIRGGSELTKAEARRFLLSLGVRDVRRDHGRQRGQFRGGWKRHVDGKPMKPKTLAAKITWNNLGFRAARRWATSVEFEDAFNVFNAVFGADGRTRLILDDEDRGELGALEGAGSLRLHRSIERSRRVVEQTKKHRGTRCEVCNFDFEEVYGALGEGYIEAHHRVPLAERGAAVTNIERDMRVLCANCHRMMHRLMALKGGVVDVDDLKAVMSNS